jgi:hypothetical protein
MPVAVTLSFRYPSTLSIAGPQAFAPLSSALNANASVTGSVPSSTTGTVTVTTSGAVLATGPLLQVAFNVAAGAPVGINPITITNIMIVNAGMQAIPAFPQSGSVTVVNHMASTVTVGTTAAQTGTNVSLPVSLAVGMNASPVSFEIELLYPSLLSIAGAGSFTAGAAVTNAGATLSGTVTSPTTALVTITPGATPMALASGNLFNINFAVGVTGQGGPQTVQISRLVIRDASGSVQLSQTVSGSVNVTVNTANLNIVTLATVNGTPNMTSVMPATFTKATNLAPVAVQVDMSFSGDLSTTGGSVTAGPAAQAAGATVTANTPTATTLSVVVANFLTPTTINNGVLFNINFNILFSANPGLKAVTITRVVVADANAMPLPVVGVDGGVNVGAAAGSTALRVQDASTPAPGFVDQSVRLDLAAQAAPTTIITDVTFAPGLSVAGPQSFSAGQAAIAVGASVSATITGANSARITIQNQGNPTAFPVGELFRIQFTVANGVPNGGLNVQLANVSAVDAMSMPVTIVGVGGQVLVQAAPATSTLTAGAINGIAGNNALMPFTLANASGSAPTSIQVNFSFPTGISIPSPVLVFPGVVSTSAGAILSATPVSATSYSVSISGGAALTNGPLFSVAFAISPSALAGANPITITSITASGAAGAITVQGVNGSINVTVPPPPVQVNAGIVTGSPGSFAILPLNFIAGQPNNPTEVILNLSFAAPLTLSGAVPGSAAGAAGAGAVITSTSPTTATLRVTNAATPTRIPDGVLANVVFAVAPAAAAGPVTITITSLTVRDAMGQAIQSVSTNGRVDVLPPPLASTLAVGMVSGVQGDFAELPVALSIGQNASPFAVQLDIAYNTTDLNILNNNRFLIGPGASGAGAAVQGNVLAPGMARVLVIPSLTNPQALIGGELFRVRFDVAAGATVGASSVTISNIIVSDASAVSLPLGRNERQRHGHGRTGDDHGGP